MHGGAPYYRSPSGSLVNQFESSMQVRYSRCVRLVNSDVEFLHSFPHLTLKIFRCAKPTNHEYILSRCQWRFQTLRELVSKPYFYSSIISFCLLCLFCNQFDDLVEWFIKKVLNFVTAYLCKYFIAQRKEEWQNLLPNDRQCSLLYYIFIFEICEWIRKMNCEGGIVSFFAMEPLLDVYELLHDFSHAFTGGGVCFNAPSGIWLQFLVILWTEDIILKPPFEFAIDKNRAAFCT
jgi:hypothetical protein